MSLRILVLTALFTVALSESASAQGTPATILDIGLDNMVNYFNDVTDYSKLAIDSNRTTVAAQPNFAQSIGIADIVSVNGKPVKGLFTERRIQLTRRVNPTAGQAIADGQRGAIMERHYEILKMDGTQIGTIATTGMGSGTPPPGAPLGVSDASFIIIGGNGAFLGVRGQASSSPVNNTLPDARNASMAEDPRHRRMLGGGGQRHFILHVIPLSRPEVVITANGPAVVHSNDFSLVTAAKPARAGEMLSLFAIGLGPTQPGIDPGKPFPASPLSLANSPVDVTVNGQPAEVQYAGGYPGTTDTYQVNFRVPSGIPSGPSSLQISAAWIAGPEVKIAIQQ
jgi:hypothetical protein